MSTTYIKINNKNKKKRVKYTDSPISSQTKKGGFYIVSKAFVKEGITNPKAKLSVRRGDMVMVISGSDKGKTGKIVATLPREGKVIVEGINKIKKHQKPRGMGQSGEIIEKEAPIFASKVMFYDQNKKKPTRIGHKLLKDGKKVRVSKVSGEQID